MCDYPLNEQLKDVEVRIGRCIDNDGIVFPHLRKLYLQLREEKNKLTEAIKNNKKEK